MDRDLLRRQRVAESAQRYYRKNRERILAYQKVYHQRIRSQMTEKDIEEDRAFWRLRRQAMTPEERAKRNEYQKQYYYAHREKLQAYQREYAKKKKYEKMQFGTCG